MKKILISPSLLSADLLNIEKEVRELEACGVDALHIDVMDGHFVPNLTFGLPVLTAVKKITSLPLDVHIMVSNPDLVAESYVKAGADILTFHVEASLHPYRILQSIKKLGAKAGVAVNPGTSVSVIEPLRDSLDMLLLLSVNPGFSGQDFIPVVFDKLKTISQWEKNKIPTMLAVDGGITEQNIGKLAALGANFFVTGSYFFKTDKKISLQNLRKAVQ